MENQSTKQYFVPPAYLANFTDRQGNLCCHDSRLDDLQQDTPENTAFASVNAVEDAAQQKLLDYIETAYAQVEATAEKIFPKLTAFQSLDPQEKSGFALFMATVFARSPAQLRQFSAQYDETERRNRQPELEAFQQCEDIAKLMVEMTWTYEISANQELITSDNSVFWVNGSTTPIQGSAGFGLGHQQAVVPFPISPRIILRLGWQSGKSWERTQMDKQRAKLCNQYQAKNKERFMYFRSPDRDFCQLALKHNKLSKMVNLDSNK